VPGFHDVAPPANSPAYDHHLASSGYDPRPDLAWPTEAGSGSIIRPTEDGSNPFSLRDRRHPIADANPALDAASFPPFATSLLLPRMADWRLPSPGPQSDDGDLDAAQDRSMPDHGIEPGHDFPGFRAAARVRRPSSDQAPLLGFGRWACEHLARGGERDAAFVARGADMLRASLLPNFFWGGDRTEPALWLKAI
jgi:hypothetical protein